MGTKYFLNTQTFAAKLTNTNGGTVNISGPLANLYKRWCIPFRAGGAGGQLGLFGETEFSGVDYTQSLGTERQLKTGIFSNPFLMTVENIDGEPNVVVYGLNLKIPPQDIVGPELNLNVQNGDNTLVRLKGGDPDTIQGGVSWSEDLDDGKVEDPNKNEIKDTVLFTDEEDENEEKKYPMPIVFFNRTDMS